MTEMTYWASQPPLECVQACEERTDSYYQALNTSGRLDLYITSYAYYHSILANQISNTGVSGFSTIAINHYRNLLQHLLTMTVSQRPAFEPRATNSDHSSQTQTILARGLLDYYMRDKHLEVYLRDAVESALLFGEAFLLSEWDSSSGEIYAINPDTNAEVREGDVIYSTAHPLDVIRDVYSSRADDCQWYIVKRLKNKYDLAAKYPELADNIVNFTDTSTNRVFNVALQSLSIGDTDLVPLYTLYHNRTPACPDGRVVSYLDNSTILFDGPLPYRTNPVNRIAPSEQIGTPFGYSVMFDLIPVQECLNGIYSTIKTNQETFGVQNVLVPKGSGFGIKEIVGGLNMIEYTATGEPGGGKPEALNLTKTAPEMFSFMNTLEKLMETLSGVNSVARGDPQASLKSGAALALVQAQAIQFSYNLQYAYTKLLENTGQSTINILRDYASVPRIAAIVGKNNQTEMREFTGKDLSSVNRVLVDQGNPMTRTTAGKVELAQMLVQMKLIDTPEQLLMVIQTGNLEVMTEGRTQELLGIKSENEFMSDGKKVPVMITDDHLLHIHEHKCVLSDPAARTAEGIGAQIATVTMAHIQEHAAMLQNPEIAPLLMLLGQQPVPQQAALGEANLAGGVPSAAAPSMNEMAQGMQPDMPNMPKNPMTGETYVPPAGPGG